MRIGRIVVCIVFYINWGEGYGLGKLIYLCRIGDYWGYC